MHKFFLTIIAAALLVSSFMAPAHAGGEDELLGLGLGGALGGIFGNQFGHGAGRVAATTAGVFAGAYAGDAIGRSLDQPSVSSSPSGGAPYAPAPLFDQDYQASYAPNYVAPSAPDPSSIYMDNGGACHEFSQQVQIGGRLQENYGTVCLQPDGSWRVVQ